MGAVLSVSMTAGVRADSAHGGFTLPMMSMSPIPQDDGEASNLMESEAGTMIMRSAGVSIRPGMDFGTNKERGLSIGAGLRFVV